MERVTKIENIIYIVLYIIYLVKGYPLCKPPIWIQVLIQL